MTGHITIFAPAKINITLRITGRRGDGYHDLRSHVAFADIGDVIHIQPSKNSKDQISISGQFAPQTPMDGNLALKTVAALRDIVPSIPFADICLEKNIPVGAGLGGGSADCAAIIRWAMEYNSDLAEKAASGAFAPARFAKSIGADVPVCIASKPAIMSGIGDIIEPWDHVPNMHGILVFPHISIATPQIFAAWKQNDKTNSHSNDLFAPACLLHPQLQEIDAAIAQLDAQYSGMTGSGSCFYALSPQQQDGKTQNTAKWAAQMQDLYPDFWIRAVKTGASQI